jgi:hypothetical protein
MSGVVRIEIWETIEELTTLMRKEKDVLRHEKLQVLYWLKTQTVAGGVTTPPKTRQGELLTHLW